MERIKIQGMNCQHCVMSVNKALNSIPGLTNVRVNLVTGEATFENTRNVSQDKICQAVEDAGYKVVAQKILS